jgi:hypothetical protein
MATVRVRIVNLTVRITLSVCPFNRMAHTANKDGANNLLFESQQNLLVLLFGLTVDDVRKTFLVSFLSPVLTIFLFCSRALVS